jgi:AraC family transcriptional regulator, exoenzyme S synthesis regulatory protein ExsA
MKENTYVQLNNLLYSCHDQIRRGNEQFVPEHSLGYIVSGESHFSASGGTRVAKAGMMGLIRRNQLLKSVKIPPPGGEFRSMNILFDQAFLRRYSVENGIGPVGKYQGDPMLELRFDPFIKGFFDSLLPYFAHSTPLGANMAEIKTREAIELLLQHDPALRDFLFDFSEPYKIDLEAFMNQNYMYNVTATQFARLTGRSLAGFKRDFRKIFQVPPSQWLLRKRLAEAYYQIREKGQKPVDVYINVGFENLSHFSYSFKKEFGVAPSML